MARSVRYTDSRSVSPDRVTAESASRTLVSSLVSPEMQFRSVI